MRTRDKVAIGWLSPGVVDAKFAMSVAIIYRDRADRVKALFAHENGGLLSRGRNELVAQYLAAESGCDWLLMLDSDEKIDLDAFDKLISVAHGTERPIVAGVYFGAFKGDPYPLAVPLIFKAKPGTSRFDPIWDYPENQVIPIDSAGTGCLLVHRSVFEKFQADADPRHEGPNWCWFLDRPVNGDWYSEDHWFCSRARELGFPLHAHTGALLEHRKQFWVSEKHHNRDVWRQSNEKDEHV
jgi:hypothetical protein